MDLVDARLFQFFRHEKVSHSERVHGSLFVYSFILRTKKKGIVLYMLGPTFYGPYLNDRQEKTLYTMPL